MTEFHLPSDGSVIIVDDKPEEALPLIKFLSKKAISSTFYSGTDDEELPTTPTQKVRLAFFDIQLYGGSDSHNYAQTILRLLEKLIPENNGPYVLILWSGRIEDHAEEVEKQVTAPASKRKPLSVIRLEKSSFFRSNDDDSEIESLLDQINEDLESAFDEQSRSIVSESIRRHYPIRSEKILVSDAMELISNELNHELKEHIDIFQVFTIWESIIKKASGETVQDFSSLHPSNPFWSENIMTSLFRMAHAYLGKNVNDFDQREILKNAVKIINNVFLDLAENHCQFLPDLSKQVLIDKRKGLFSLIIDERNYTLIWDVKTDRFKIQIDNEILNKNSVAIGSVANQGRNEGEKEILRKVVEEFHGIEPKINTKLLIDTNLPDHVQPGNVYEKKAIHWARKKKLLKNYFKSDKNTSVINKKGEILLNNEQIKTFKFIELEVTPICDYAQKKWRKYRLLPGLMIPQEYAINLEHKENFYKEMPKVQIGGINYQILFDFKFLKSVDQVGYISEKPIFRLRNDLFSSILSRLSSHASRVGLAFVG